MSEPDAYLKAVNLHGRWDAETSIVELDIPRQWRLWSGYYLGGPKARWNEECKWWELEEPMDEDDFDESTAFPLLKPAIDVFGPPRLSQRQRGWYYVRTWPPRSPSSPLDSDSRPALATAAEIPEELFEHILSVIGWDRHTLAKCGQVCRYWASQCRPRLFRNLHLRSREDALGLRAWKKDPACQFLPYLQFIIIEMAGLSALNWIHLFRDGYQLELSLTGPLPASVKTLRSIHQAIPRSLPRSFSPRISHLYLTNICFRRFEDLVHLLDELPDLEKLYCTKVTWGSIPAQFPRRPPTAESNHLRYLWMEQCNHSCTQAATFLLRGMISRAYIHNDTLSTLMETLELESTVSLEWWLRGHSDTRHLYFRHGGLQFDLSAEPHDPASVPGGSSSFRLTAFAITLYYKIGNGALVDWGKLDIFIDKLPLLRIVVFGFSNWDKKSMLRFAEGVDEQMPLSFRRNLIRYAVQGDSVGWGWRRVSRRTSELEGPGCEDLCDVYAQNPSA